MSLFPPITDEHTKEKKIDLNSTYNSYSFNLTFKRCKLRYIQVYVQCTCTVIYIYINILHVYVYNYINTSINYFTKVLNTIFSSNSRFRDSS